MQSKKKNRVIIALVVIVAFMAVGYAILQQQLTINGTANIDAKWKVEITGIEGSFSEGASNTMDDDGMTEITPTFDATSATFNATLPVPGAEADYTITVTNNGTIPAMLNGLPEVDTINAQDPEQIQYVVEFADGDEGKYRLEPEESVQFVVAVYWDSNDEVGVTEPVSKEATITLNYTQAPEESGGGD